MLVEPRGVGFERSQLSVQDVLVERPTVPESGDATRAQAPRGWLLRSSEPPGRDPPRFGSARTRRRVLVGGVELRELDPKASADIVEESCGTGLGDQLLDIDGGRSGKELVKDRRQACLVLDGSSPLQQRDRSAVVCETSDGRRDDADESVRWLPHMREDFLDAGEVELKRLREVGWGRRSRRPCRGLGTTSLRNRATSSSVSDGFTM